MFLLVHEAIDGASLTRQLAAPHAGACLTYEDWAPDHHAGRKVLAMELSAYEPLASLEGARVLEEAERRFDVLRIHAVQRLGRLEAGQTALWIGVSAPDRLAALMACEYVIESLKARLPLMKREHYADGDSGWLNCLGGEAEPHPAQTGFKPLRFARL